MFTVRPSVAAVIQCCPLEALVFDNIFNDLTAGFAGLSCCTTNIYF